MKAIKQKLAGTTKDESRDGGMALALMLLILYLAFRRKEVLLAAIAVHVVNMTVPQVFRPFALVWMGLSEALGAVVSKALMMVVFFCVVAPIGVFRRLAGKDSLGLRKFRAKADSVMVARDHVFVASDLERPY